MKRIMFCLALVVMSSSVVARYHIVKSSAALEDLVEKYAYSVVCFAPSGQLQGEDLDTDEKKERKRIFKSLQNVVKAASNQGVYKTYVSQDIGFLVVDVAAKRASLVADEYHVKDDPLCVVFEQGAPDTKTKVMRPAAPRDLIRLLEAEGGDDLKDLIDDRKQDAQMARQERIASYYAYGAAYPYGYGPYGYGGPYAWSPYWRSPYVGWGFYAGGW